jgi:hypothetical protein
MGSWVCGADDKLRLADSLNPVTESPLPPVMNSPSRQKAGITRFQSLRDYDTET